MKMKLRTALKILGIGTWIGTWVGFGFICDYVKGPEIDDILSDLKRVYSRTS